MTLLIFLFILALVFFVVMDMLSRPGRLRKLAPIGLVAEMFWRLPLIGLTTAARRGQNAVETYFESGNAKTTNLIRSKRLDGTAKFNTPYRRVPMLSAPLIV